MQKILGEVLEENRELAKKGRVASYIPALAKANPDHLGICIAEIDGNTYKAGDCDVKFTIQSISKVIALMLALMDNGEKVFEKVGREGTEDPFNTLYKLDLPYIDKPANPMINAGAIATTAQIKGDKAGRILELIRNITGNSSIDYSREVYLSEKETGEKNKAIAHLMKARGILEGDPEEALDHYFKQCSIEVTACDLAKLGAFLANGCKGLPSYGKIDRKTLSRNLLAIMTIGGMYNVSGAYAAEVGVPSKSGVGGGIMASVPGRMGIGIFSPPLDENGHSVAGYGIMKSLSYRLDLSIF
ncbi:MAG: glutaminase A [Tepidanaerobacteraceae bacterium]